MNTEHDELSQAEDPEEDMGGDESPESEDGPLTDVPPAESHGWLEQFSHFSHESFDEIRNIVEAGINSAERVILMKVALRLFAFAGHNLKEPDFTPEQKQEIENLVLELETALHLSP